MVPNLREDRPSLLAVRSAAFAAMTRLLQRAPPRDRTFALQRKEVRGKHQSNSFQNRNRAAVG